MGVFLQIPKKVSPGKQVAVNLTLNFTPKTSHCCLKKKVLSYVFQVLQMLSRDVFLERF